MSSLVFYIQTCEWIFPPIHGLRNVMRWWGLSFFSVYPLGTISFVPTIQGWCHQEREGTVLLLSLSFLLAAKGKQWQTCPPPPNACPPSSRPNAQRRSEQCHSCTSSVSLPSFPCDFKAATVWLPPNQNCLLACHGCQNQGWLPWISQVASWSPMFTQSLEPNRSFSKASVKFQNQLPEFGEGMIRAGFLDF